MNPASKDPVRNQVRRQKYKQNRIEEELVNSARRMIATNAPGAEATLSAALDCTAGKRAFPVLAKHKDAVVLAKAVEGGVLMMGTTSDGKKKNSQDKATFVAWLDFMCGGLTSAQISAMGVTAGYLRGARQKRLAQKIPPHPRFFDAKYTVANRLYLRTPDDLQCAVVQVFYNYSFVLSGAPRPTRNFALSAHEWFAIMHGHWPSILRTVIHNNPAALTNKRTGYQRDLRLAQRLALEPDFDESREFQTRYKEFMTKYARRVARQRRKAGKLIVPPQEAPEPAWSSWSQQPDTVNLEDDESGVEAKSDSVWSLQTSCKLSKPTAVTPATFEKILVAKNVRYTTCTHESRCPLHDNGPVWEIRKKNVVTQLDGMPGTDERLPALKKQLRVLEPLVKRYHRHLKQFAVQRTRVQEIERTLPPRHAVAYRDFVNMYMPESNGTTNQLKNLQLVIRWREKVGEPLRTMKVSNLCSDKNTPACDAYFVADVLDFHC